MRSKNVKALAVAIGCCALMFLVAVGIKLLPLSDQLQETLIAAVLWPLSLMTRSLSFLVDTFGPKGRAEPASAYLPAWGIRSMVALSVVLLVALFFGVARVILERVDRKRAAPGV
jgi:hypothetical protein